MLGSGRDGMYNKNEEVFSWFYLSARFAQLGVGEMNLLGSKIQISKIRKAFFLIVKFIQCCLNFLYSIVEGVVKDWLRFCIVMCLLKSKILKVNKYKYKYSKMIESSLLLIISFFH